MRNRSLRAAACVLLFVVVSVCNPIAEGTGPNWLERVNFYRASASLPPVAENPALSGGVRQHARYMVMHSEITHSPSCVLILKAARQIAVR